MGVKLVASSGGSVELVPTNTASNFTVTVPAVTASMLTDSSGVMNIGSGQVYKDSSGNVGVGTTSPSGRVHAVSAAGTVQVRWSDATNGTANLDTASGLSRIWTNVGLAFGTGAETFTERARIDSSGNLLVGTTSSYGGMINFLTSASRINAIVTRPATNITYNAADFQNSSGTGVGGIGVTASSTSYVTSSDYRLKHDIQPMTGALAKVAALKPVTYKWNADDSESQGFIAHELQAVVPECVTGEKDAVDAEGNPKYQGIDTSFLVATLTAAIQEQQALITQLQADVAALKGTA